MEENKQVENVLVSEKPKRKVIQIRLRKLTFIFFIFILIILFLWVAISLLKRDFSVRDVMYTGNTSMKSTSSLNYNYSEESSSIEDTREFMKTSYNSTIKTRNVSKIVTSVKNIIKGSDGRVDNISSSEKYGYIDFVVPKSNFDEFKIEIENLTHYKFYTENVSSTNLLSEKQNIEERTDNANNSLSGLIYQKNILNNNHTSSLNSINKEMTRIQSELNNLRININKEINEEILVSLRNQESVLVSQYSYQKQKLEKENNDYNTKINNLNSLINNENANLDNLQEEDGDFMADIETVEGYISVRWISVWGILVLFSPIHPIFEILIIIIVLIIIWRKRLPKIEFVK